MTTPTSKPAPVQYQEQRYWAYHCGVCKRYYSASGVHKPTLCVDRNCAAAHVILKPDEVIYTGCCSLSMPQLFLELDFDSRKLQRAETQLAAQAQALKDLQLDYNHQHETLQRLLNKVDELEKQLVQSTDKK